MRARRFGSMAAAVAAAVAVAGCTDVRAGTPPGTPPGTPGAAVFGLVAFDSCGTALRDLTRAAAPYVGPYGLGGPDYVRDVAVSSRADSAGAGSAAPSMPEPAAAEHSTTTVHEAGVDEPDLVKTDGRRLVTLAGGRLRVVDLATRRVTTVRGLPDGPSEQLLLHGDRALVMLPGGYQSTVEDQPAGARFVLVDLTGAGRVLGTLTVDGSFVDARQVGSVARVVVRSGPRLRFVQPDGRYADPAGRSRADGEAARRQNLRVLARSSIDDWLPRYELTSPGERQQGRLVACDRVSRPARYTGSSMLTVLTLDLAGTLGTGDPVSVVADGDTVYGTTSSLYVAAGQPLPVPQGPVWGPAPLPRQASVPERTEIHRFDVGGTARPRYVASGVVDGVLLNQYSMSEYDGRLRVATTSVDLRGTEECCDRVPSQSAVTVLAQRDDRLVPVGRLAGLGRGEQIHAVRFLGPVGYVVTFRQTDPLYTVDLSDPEHPRAVGELKITGYSAYLHPTGPGELLGVGQEASTSGRQLGTQVSLFDVGDPARPRRIARYHLADGQSEVEFDPHAFLYWPASGLVVLPVTEAGRGGPVPETGALVLRRHDGALERVGLLRHPGGGVIRRSLVVGDTLWTVSETGAQAVAAGDLSPRAWVPFS